MTMQEHTKPFLLNLAGHALNVALLRVCLPFATNFGRALQFVLPYVSEKLETNGNTPYKVICVTSYK